MKKIIIGIVLLISFVAIASAANNQQRYQTGDIIFQTTKGKIALVTSTATMSRFTHVGMIIMKKNKPYVIEASGPVRINSFRRFINRGIGKKFVVLRYKNGLNKKQKRKLIREARRHIGKKYDSKFRWDDKKLYCSELVFKVYKKALRVELNKPEKLGDYYSSWNPIISRYAKKKYGKKIPLNEKIITPERLYDSKPLTTVYSNYFKLN